MEHIALHAASTFGGAQFYVSPPPSPLTVRSLLTYMTLDQLSCGQLNVVNGGSGTPGPLVAIPGVYTGYEPGILINIYYPVSGQLYY